MLCVSIIFNFQFSTFNPVAAQSRNFTITGDVTVNAMVERHVEFNNRVKTIPGFRVQIASFSGANSKNSAFTLRDRFAQDYPSVQAYIIYDEPNFKVKVGELEVAPVVEFYLRGQDTDVYKAVENLKVGDEVVLDGYLYWYEGANPHIIGVEVK